MGARLAMVLGPKGEGRPQGTPLHVLRNWRAEWSGGRDSNPRPPAWKAGALPLSYPRVGHVERTGWSGDEIRLLASLGRGHLLGRQELYP